MYNPHACALPTCNAKQHNYATTYSTVHMILKQTTIVPLKFIRSKDKKQRQTIFAPQTMYNTRPEPIQGTSSLFKSSDRDFPFATSAIHCTGVAAACRVWGSGLTPPRHFSCPAVQGAAAPDSWPGSRSLCGWLTAARQSTERPADRWADNESGKGFSTWEGNKKASGPSISEGGK